MRKAVTGGLFQWEEGSLAGGDRGPDEGTEEGSSGAPQGVEESEGGRSEDDGDVGGLSERGCPGSMLAGPALRKHGEGSDLQREEFN